MTLADYWAILIKRWRIVVLCLLLVGSGAAVGSKLTKPLYQSSVLIEVVVRSASNNASDYNNQQASQQLAQTEVMLATSTPVLREVVSHYQGITIGQLESETSAAVSGTTQLFTINVVDPNPETAATLANDVAATLIKQQEQATQQQNAQSQQQIQQNINATS